MTNPVYKIEIYDSVPALIHTITKNVLSIRIKETLTDNTGMFSFTVPSEIGNAYKYNDITVNDQVKVWLDYDSVSGNPLTVGNIQQITNTAEDPAGFMRHFACMNQGEVLKRRIKTRKAWEGIGASTIVEELCDDLGLGKTEVTADATAVTLTTDGETYWDILAKVSDYWFDPGTQVKKDFFVSWDNKLHWKSRPIRTAGVESLVLGENLLTYSLLEDQKRVKNQIWVYGEQAPYDPNRAVLNYTGRTYPVGGDEWTYGTGWTATKGTLSSDATAPKVGASDLRCTADGAHDCQFNRTFSQMSVEGKEGFTAVQFWGRRDALLADDHHVRIWCPDNANYFEWEFADPGVNDTWAFRIARLGDNNTYDADTNPNGEWTVGAGSPTWNNMQGIEFLVDSGGAFHWDTDGLCFSFGRWRSSADDAASKTSYEQRDWIIVDDLLKSDAECQTRAETLLYQQKDKVRRLDVVIDGNKNVLIGDRIPITLAPENISAVDFDVVTVEHLWGKDEQGWATHAVLVDSGNIREPPVSTQKEFSIKQARMRSSIEKGVKMVAR